MICTRTAVRECLPVICEQVLSSATSFLTGILIARSTPVEEFGLFVLAMTVGRIALSMQSSLVSLPFTFLSSRTPPRERATYLGSSLVEQWLVSGAATAFLFPFWLAAAQAAGHPLSITTSLAVPLASISSAARDFFRMMLLAEMRVRAALLLGALANLATLVLLIAFRATGSLSITLALAAIAAGSALPTAGVMALLRAEIAFVPARFGADFRRNWDFGGWQLGKSLAAIPALQVFPWGLTAVVGTASAGLYGACMTLAAVPGPLYMSLAGYLMPKISRTCSPEPDRARPLVWYSVAVMWISFALLTALAVTWGDVALAACFGTAYRSGSRVLLLCMGASAFISTATLLEAGINGLGRPRSGFLARLAGAGVAVLAGLPLMFLFGTAGAALGLLISSATTALLDAAAFMRVSCSGDMNGRTDTLQQAEPSLDRAATPV